MKNLKMILSAIMVITAVSGAFAFKTFLHKDIFKCDPVALKCVFGGQNYSSVNPGSDPVIPPFQAYQGALNQVCGNPGDPCQPYAGPVYINQ